ncbi:MAG: lytic transglycosylase domain-containing protein [Alphaproteobacteria bacterium]
MIAASSKVLAACLMLASQTYSVPPAVLVGIYKVEGGKVGQEVKNENGSFDLGPMQINTVWMPELAGEWGVSKDTARKWVRDDACTNVSVAAWILRSHLDETGSLSQAIANYHSRTPVYGTKYKKKVINVLYENGLVRNGH